MGVDAKLAVVCKKEEKMTVVGQILHTLNKLAIDKLRTKYECCTLSMLEVARLEEEHYTRDAILSTRDFSTFTIRFGVGDKYQRQAFVLTTCECDVDDILSAYDETYGAVLFSVGYWGKSELILNFVAQELSKSYDVYVDYNDSDDVDYVKFQGEM